MSDPSALEIGARIEALVSAYAEHLRQEAITYFRWRAWTRQRRTAELARLTFAELSDAWTEALALDQALGAITPGQASVERELSELQETIRTSMAQQKAGFTFDSELTR